MVRLCASSGLVLFLLATATTTLCGSAATVRGSQGPKDAKNDVIRSLQSNNQNMESVNPNGAPYVPVGTNGIGEALVGDITITSNNDDNSNSNSNSNNNDGGSTAGATTTEGTPGNGESGSQFRGPGTCPNRLYTDIVIIGAGMAGVAAAATLEEQGVDYIMLESTNRVGGRVRSQSFGVPSNTWTVEEGANWVLNVQDNPLLGLMETNELNAPPQDYFSRVIYGEDGQPVDPGLFETELARFETAWQGAANEAENQWTADHALYNDNGVVALLANQGWAVGPGKQADLDYILQWWNVDWEYTTTDVSVRYFPPWNVETFLVADPRGYEYLIQQHFQTNVDPTRLVIIARVSHISYNENIQNGNGKTYKAIVTTNTNGTSCTDYIAQRVISTVSTGVINNNLIQFSPPLTYGTSTNPYEMGTFIKIFYQFDNKFWDDDEFIEVVRDLPHRGQCHHWQNMDAQMPGSNIIRCEVMKEAFEKLIDPSTKELTQVTLNSLLDPLRLVYGADVVGSPIDVYATKINKDADFGFGAYASWKIGYTFNNFGQFFGIQQLAPYCDHNGCNAQGEWILHFSGAATCYQHAETVHGAYFSGESSANYVMQELGFDVDADSSPCDVNWQWLN